MTGTNQVSQPTITEYEVFQVSCLGQPCLFLGVPISTTSTKEQNKVEPRPFDDDQSDSSELSSEDDREQIGLDFT